MFVWFLLWHQDRLPVLEYEKLLEDYPRFPDIHDVHIAQEDMGKIVVRLESCGLRGLTSNVVTSYWASYLHNCTWEQYDRRLWKRVFLGGLLCLLIPRNWQLNTCHVGYMLMLIFTGVVSSSSVFYHWAYNFARKCGYIPLYKKEEEKIHVHTHAHTTRVWVQVKCSCLVQLLLLLFVIIIIIFSCASQDVTPYMTPCPYTVSTLSPIPYVFNLFRTMGLRHLPVLDSMGQVTRAPCCVLNYYSTVAVFPYIDILYIDILYIDILYIDILYIDILYIDILYIDILYIDILYIDILYIDILYIDMLYIDMLYIDMLYIDILYIDILYIDILYIDILYIDIPYFPAQKQMRIYAKKALLCTKSLHQFCSFTSICACNRVISFKIYWTSIFFLSSSKFLLYALSVDQISLWYLNIAAGFSFNSKRMYL